MRYFLLLLWFMLLTIRWLHIEFRILYDRQPFYQFEKINGLFGFGFSLGFYCLFGGCNSLCWLWIHCVTLAFILWYSHFSLLSCFCVMHVALAFAIPMNHEKLLLITIFIDCCRFLLLVERWMHWMKLTRCCQVYHIMHINLVILRKNG